LGFARPRALARGRDFFAFFRALGRDAFFFRAGARFAFGRVLLGSPIIGAGVGAEGWDGIDGIIGSIMPGPVQPLSEKSVSSSIGSLLRWLSVGVAYSLPCEGLNASDEATLQCVPRLVPARRDKFA